MKTRTAIWIVGALAAVLAREPAAALQLGPSPQADPPDVQDTSSRRAPGERHAAYILGPDDQIVVRAADVDEINEKPVRIDLSGNLRLPMVGRLHAAGLTVEQLEAAISTRLKEYVKAPDVSVMITDFRSQPVSVIGSVKNPGVHQLQGRKTLIEVLALAGGLSDDAGYSVKITRQLAWGRIPLSTAHDDASGRFSVAEVSLKTITEARNPSENIIIRPEDVISVPRADMVYVIGQVQRSGGFVLHERETLSVLQALSLAGGLDRASSPQKARILRSAPAGGSRIEIPVDVKRILAGTANDVSMNPEDILFIPASAPKKAIIRGIEAAIQLGTGVAVYRR